MQFQITFPTAAFYHEAQKEYSNIYFRLIVEFLQNSIDAGSTRIYFEYDESSRVLWVKDNGTGMDKDILVNGMLAYEGSIKKEGATGGFGAAKKILLFSHEWFEIKTMIYHAKGKGINYSLEEMPMDKLVLGCHIGIKFGDYWPEFNVFQTLKDVLGWSDIKAEVYYNDEKVEVEKLKIVESYDAPDATISKANERLCAGTIVRFNGLYMFYSSAPNHAGYIYNCKSPSREALTQNRESFRNGTDSYKHFNEFIRTVTNNSISGYSTATKVKKAEELGGEVCGMHYIGLPPKLMKKHKQFFCLAKTVLNRLNQDLEPYNFGICRIDGIMGLCKERRIYINPDYFDGEDWEFDCITTIIHELTHRSGYMEHNESFISANDICMTTWMKSFTGINPVRAEMRKWEKAYFPD
jgi:hypothetical protein